MLVSRLLLSVLGACCGLMVSMTPSYTQAATTTPATTASTTEAPRLTQAIPLSVARVAKVLGQPGVYIYDCNPEDIYQQSHIKGAIHANVEGWQKLLPKDKENSFLIFYCINRLCNVSWETSLAVIQMGYKNVYVMPDGIHGWVQNGYEFEGTGRHDPGISLKDHPH